MRTAVAAADPDEPDRPLSAPRPDHLRAVGDQDDPASSNGLGDLDRTARDALMAEAARLSPEGRRGLAERLRAELVVLNGLDDEELDKADPPDLVAGKPGPEQAATAPTISVGAETNAYLAALATLAQHGPVGRQLTSESRPNFSCHRVAAWHRHKNAYQAHFDPRVACGPGSMELALACQGGRNQGCRPSDGGSIPSPEVKW